MAPPKLSNPITKTNSYISRYYEKKKIPYPNKQTTIEFKMRGYREIANAFRRTLLDEIDGVKKLTLVDLETTEEQLIYYKIGLIIDAIPIQQSVQEGKEYVLEFQNKSEENKYINTHDLKGLDKITNQMPLFYIRGGKSVFMKVKVETGVGWKNSNFSLVNSIGFKDNAPDTNRNCFVDEPTEFEFTLYTNGTLGTRDLLEIAKNSLLDRIERVRKQIDEIKFDQSLGSGRLKIEGETHTFKNWFTELGLRKNTEIGGSAIEQRSRSFILMINATSRESAIKILNECLDIMRNEIRGL